MKKTKKILASSLIVSMTLLTLTGCFRKEQPDVVNKSGLVELSYYTLNSDETTMKTLITQYQAKNPSVKINLKNFKNQAEYENTILDELSEGAGPDLFSMPNYWFYRNYRKVSPAPGSLVSDKVFDDVFVSVASKDLVFVDGRDNKRKVFGIPLYIDTLALYYNKDVFDDKIPSKGKPSETWEGIKEDTALIAKKDNSFERFELAGIAMGREDNIRYANDILYLLMLQYKAKIYNANYSQMQLLTQKATLPSGESYTPALEALKLYTSFALPTQKNYSWNNYLADASSDEKELDTFSRGKVSMILGYSDTYAAIQNKVKGVAELGGSSVSMRSVKILPVPQVFDPRTSSEKRDVLAKYYAETVSRNSKYPDLAWDFLAFASSKDAAKYYNEQTKRPTARRDLIEEQKQDPIYGVFAEQTGFADSFPIYDNALYTVLFAGAINDVLNTISLNDALKKVEDKVNNVLPVKGFVPSSAPIQAAQ